MKSEFQIVVLAETGNVKVAVAVLLFSVFSFFLSFGTVWVALVGFDNPLAEKGAEKTVEDMAIADSLRAVEMSMKQDIDALRAELEKLNIYSDSLSLEINSRKSIVKKLENEIARLNQQVGGEQQERIQKLAGIVTGLSENTLRKITDDMDFNILVSLVLNASQRKATVLLNAMEPQRAAKVTKEIARIKNANSMGG